MPSHADDRTAQKRVNSPGRLDGQRAITNQQDHSAGEYSNKLQYIIDNKEDLMKRYGYQKFIRNKRFPRYYFVNNNNTLLIILQGDITKTKVDAIVNAANEHMTGGAGVDGIIHNAAGSKLYDACVAHKKISSGVRLPTGHSRILLSYNMSSTTYYIINTAGPVYYSRRAEECAKDLASCYTTALALANLYDLESIGFTAISCGIFGYPANDGAEVALKTVDEKADSVPVVVFVLWDDHIYDAWIKKAVELNFSPFDPESLPTANPSKPSVDEDKVETTKSTARNNDEKESLSTFNPTVRDNSTPDKTTEKNEQSVAGLPSLPDDTPDTQPIENMDSDSNSLNVNQRSNTVEMTTVDSEQPSTEEKTVKLNGNRSITNDDPKPPIHQNEANMSVDENAKSTQDDSTVTSNSGH